MNAIEEHAFLFHVVEVIPKEGKSIIRVFDFGHKRGMRKLIEEAEKMGWRVKTWDM